MKPAIRLLITLLYALILAGCSILPAKKTEGPKEWSIHTFVPRYAPAYANAATYVTTAGQFGVAMNADYPPQTQDPNGWKGVSVDGSYNIYGALPKEIHIVWTPLMTKQTWLAKIVVPQAMRDAMEKSYKYRDLDGSIGTGWHLTNITLGLTPNGYVRLFLIGSKGTIPSIPTRSYLLVKGELAPKLTPYADKVKNISKDEPGLKGSAIIIRSMKDYPKAEAYIAKHGIARGPW